jgi:hypothetical protein
MLISVGGTGKKISYSWDNGGCSIVVTLFFVKKSLTKTDRCAEALS